MAAAQNNILVGPGTPFLETIVHNTMLSIKRATAAACNVCYLLWIKRLKMEKNCVCVRAGVYECACACVCVVCVSVCMRVCVYVCVCLCEAGRIVKWLGYQPVIKRFQVWFLAWPLQCCCFLEHKTLLSLYQSTQLFKLGPGENWRTSLPSCSINGYLV